MTQRDDLTELVDAVINVSGHVPDGYKRADLTDAILAALAGRGRERADDIWAPEGLRERLTAWGRDLTADDELWVSVDNAIATVALWLRDEAATLDAREGDPNLWADEQQAYVDAAATVRRLADALIPATGTAP